MKKSMSSAVYVHIPYCKKKCAYCDFCSQSDFSTVQNYVNSVKKEISDAVFSRKIKSVFIGGGTPSSIDSKHIVEILNLIEQKAGFDDNVEITIEVNPESCSKEKLEDYFNAGINRLSFGWQSCNDNTLKKIGRLHTFTKAKQAVETAKEVGFSNINVDLINGLPDENESDVLFSIQTAIDCGLTHVSLYALEMHEDTPLGKNKHKFQFMNDDEVAKCYHSAVALLEKNGFYRYETSNFAKKNFECKHNLTYWNNEHYHAFGVSACGYENGVRYVNVFDVNDYVFRVSNEKSVRAEIDELSDFDKAFECVMLAMRKSQGLNLTQFESIHKLDFFDFCPKAKELVQKNILILKDGNIAINQNMTYLLNSILVELLP